MLKDSLYKIISSTHSKGAIEVVLGINKNSEIFKGHFPGQPVLPGACILQIVKEILEQELSESLRLKKADQIKFLGLVDPQIDNMLQLKITYVLADDIGFIVSGNMIFQDKVCFKFKGTFVVNKGSITS